MSWECPECVKTDEIQNTRDGWQCRNCRASLDVGLEVGRWAQVFDKTNGVKVLTVGLPGSSRVVKVRQYAPVCDKLVAEKYEGGKIQSVEMSEGDFSVAQEVANDLVRPRG